jgi:uncharacterized protein YcaQ
MKPIKISLEHARGMAVRAQLLDGRARLPKGKEGIARTIEKLGYVQIDTIAVIERAHHHTLRTRRPDYSPHMLHELQAKDRRVFEYWGHAASYLPMADYRYYLPRMRSFQNPKDKWVRERLEAHGHLMPAVLERIRQEGPLSSQDFAPPPGAKRSGWWDWKPSKVVLELLFWQGALMIAERRNFHRMYDLAERVLPEGIDTRTPDEDELGRFFVRRALSAYGVATEKDVYAHLPATSKSVLSQALADLLDAGEIVSVDVGEAGLNTYYALAETIDKTARLKQTVPGVSFLSPFDNLIILRDRVKELFGFDYSLECYVPAAKRKYGYFVLPILWGDSLVGRLDPKADRKGKVLSINNLVFETGFRQFDELLPLFANTLSEFARTNQCETIECKLVTPAKVRRPLQCLVKQALAEAASVQL